MQANNQYVLEQVVIFSRHNIRSPLSGDGETTQKVSNKKWPQWQCPPGHLTLKGHILEFYFGHYFSLWLRKHQLLTDELMSDPYACFVYANSLQRTVATAQSFVTGAFAGYDVPVHHRYPIEKHDPIFNPIVREMDEKTKDILLTSLKMVASQQIADINHTELSEAYQQLSAMLYDDLNGEPLVRFDDLPTEFDLVSGFEPIATGKLRIATAIVDAFMLQYYDGLHYTDVAWGKIDSSEKWQTLLAIKNYYMDLLFGTPKIASHIAQPILNALYQKLNEYQLVKQPKISLFVGHDSNIATILQALGVDDYRLPGQYEKTPIGGKLVFQRWYDKTLHRQLFKIEYVYQTTEQIREQIKLDLTHPPKHITLTFSDLYSQTSDGFYLWDEIKLRFKQTLI